MKPGRQLQWKELTSSEQDPPLKQGSGGAKDMILVGVGLTSYHQRCVIGLLMMNSESPPIRRIEMFALSKQVKQEILFV